MDRLGGPASAETFFARKHCLRWIRLSGVVGLAVIIVASLMSSQIGAAAHWPLGGRALFRLLRGHIDCLPRLVPTFRRCRNFHGHRGAAGSPAGFDTKSCTQSPFRTQQSRRSVGRGVTCHVPNPGMESA